MTDPHHPDDPREGQGADSEVTRPEGMRPEGTDADPAASGSPGQPGAPAGPDGAGVGQPPAGDQTPPPWAPPPPPGQAGQQWGSWPPPPPGSYGHGYGYPGYGPGYGGQGYGGYGQWGGPHQQPGRSRHNSILAVIAVAALVLLAAAVGGIAGHDLRSSNASSRTYTPYYGSVPGTYGSSGGSGSSSSGSGGPSDVASIAAKVAPALVDVNVTFSYQQAQGAGTGIVLTPDGKILTNNHVINGATSISVTDIGNGQTYKATVVGYDPTHDLAVLQAKSASGLKTASIGTSSKLQVGQGVVGIGNAGGSGGTPSSAGGSITALNQSITAGDELDGTNEQLTNLIQTNANIQAGDSGGSLVNSSGQVIGVDTAASQSYTFGGQSQSSGEGYAIPIDQAMTTVKQILAGKSSASVHVGPTAFLGVLVTNPGASGQGSQGGDFGGSSGSTNGASVSKVVAGGAAANAGLAAGDVITSFNGQSISTPTSLSHLLLPLHPGDKATIGYTDANGQAHTTTATLGSGPAS